MGRKAKDLTGQVFGKLTAIACTGDQCNGSYVWLCRCSCGNEAYVNVKSLTSGNTRSCGCMLADVQRARRGSHNIRRKPYNRRRNRSIKDLTGQRFGSLTAIEPTGEIQSGSPLWRCRCDCGNEKVTTAFCLIYGRTQYCKACGLKKRLMCLKNIKEENMTDKQFYFCCQEVSSYTDRDAYISDLALSDIWGDGEESSEISTERVEALSKIWDAFHRSIRDISVVAGMSNRKLAERFLIPYRTMENWCSGVRTPPDYVRMMMQKILGLL